jgi:peptide/nickel transport system permease protein
MTLRRQNPLLAFAVALVAVQVALALLAPWLGFQDPLKQVMAQRMRPPNALNWLGTDQLGRDVLARIVYGYRTVADDLRDRGGHRAAGGRGHRAWPRPGGAAGPTASLMRLMDVLFAFPILLLAIGIIAVLGPTAWSRSLAIAIVYTPIFARLLRGPALVICESEYVLGARAIGAGDLRIVLTHVLPNLMSVILVQASILLSAAILVEASLSFLGLGAQPPVPSLGLMLSEGRNFPAAVALACGLRRVRDPVLVLRLQPAGRCAARHAGPPPAGRGMTALLTRIVAGLGNPGSRAGPLYLQLASALRGLIELGELRGGDALPSERDLAQATGLSRVTVRKALDALCDEGLTGRRHGAGTFVARQIDQPLSVLHRLYRRHAAARGGVVVA